MAKQIEEDVDECDEGEVENSQVYPAPIKAPFLPFDDPLFNLNDEDEEVAFNSPESKLNALFSGGETLTKDGERGQLNIQESNEEVTSMDLEYEEYDSNQIKVEACSREVKVQEANLRKEIIVTSDTPELKALFNVSQAGSFGYRSEDIKQGSNYYHNDYHYNYYHYYCLLLLLLLLLITIFILTITFIILLP